MVLYIDPGTGSMLFAVFIGIASFLAYFVRVAYIKIKYFLSMGKVKELNENKIPLLIFAESKRYWGIFKPIIAELDKRGIEAEYWTMSEDDPAFEQPQFKTLKPKFIGSGNNAFAKLNMANASVLFSTTPGLNVYQWKKSKLVDYYIHLPHSPNGIAGYRMFGTDFFDALLLSGDHQIDEARVLEAKRNMAPREIELVGVPYLDDLLAKRLSNPISDNEKTCVLLAPSWGKNSIFNRFGTKIINELINTGYDLIIRPHPQTLVSEKAMITRIMEEFPDNDHLKWDLSDDNFPSLNRADIIISDYSGVIYDFSLVFDKPVIYANVDFKTDCYEYYWIEGTPWKIGVLPKIGLELNEDNLSNIKDLIDKGINEAQFKEGRDWVRENTWVHVGEGASRTADFIEKKLHEYQEKK